MRTKIVAAGLAFFAFGCSAKSGELMMAIDSDMSIPKDVDQVRMVVEAGGVVKQDSTYKVGADPEDTKLPGTFGVYDSKDSGEDVTMRIIAYHGTTARVVSKAVSTVPSDRVASIRMPIDWLCDGQVMQQVLDPATEDLPDADTSCDEGESCVAGSCVTDTVDSSQAPTFQASDVFGGGTGDGDGSCFDVQSCFAGITDVKVDPATCTFKPASTARLNVAVVTEGDGICGENGCLVALDQDPSNGWSLTSTGDVQVPKGACMQLASGKVAAIATSNACATKTASLPVCGAWSSAGRSTTTESSSAATTLSGAQDHPVAVFATPMDVFWLTTGTFGMADGKLKRTSPTGGTPQTIFENLPTPEQATVSNSGSTSTVFWTNNGVTGDGDGQILSYVIGAMTQAPTVVAKDLSTPVGIATLGGTIYFTSFATGELDAVKSGAATTVDGPFTNPAQIIASTDGTKLYLAEEGTLDMNDGNVWLEDPTDPSSKVSIKANTPHAVAADASNVYWVEFSQTNGAVKSASADLSGSATTIASNQSFPSSIAVDANNVYWTNLGDGTVWMAPKTGGAPKKLADGQYKPASIVVAGKQLTWVNQGASDSANGSVVTLTLPTAMP